MDSADATAAFELRFSSLFDEGRGYSFPCDAQGRVDLDALSEQARNRYLYARTLIGREVGMPAVRPRSGSTEAGGAAADLVARPPGARAAGTLEPTPEGL